MTVQVFGAVSISVSDLDQAVDFYTRLVGFEESRERLHIKGPSIETIFGIPTAEGDVAFLRLGGVDLELFAFQSPDGFKQNPLRFTDTGGFSMSLRSDSFDEDYRRLKAEGVSFKSEPVDYEGRSRVVVMCDPDGNCMQLTALPAEGT